VSSKDKDWEWELTRSRYHLNYPPRLIRLSYNSQQAQSQRDSALGSLTDHAIHCTPQLLKTYRLAKVVLTQSSK